MGKWIAITLLGVGLLAMAIALPLGKASDD